MCAELKTDLAQRFGGSGADEYLSVNETAKRLNVSVSF
jgi:hypothetical protein